MSEEDEEITKENFHEYFFDTRQHKPKSGQIMAKYRAIAEFVSGQAKRDIIYLLKIGKTYQATQVMKKIHSAKEPDCYRLLKSICKDLMTGLSEEEIEQKPYEYEMELFFYTTKDCVPKHDPHWETIDLMEYDSETKTFKSVIEIPEAPEKLVSVSK